MLDKNVPVPSGRLLKLADAKLARKLLMDERGVIGKTVSGATFERSFSLCEH